MIEESGDSLDILLIFAALFSGVVTTLVVETSGSLDTDYAEVTANLLQEMVALQRAGDNATARAAVSAAQLTTPPTNTDVWVNGLWFTSLTLSLSTALLAVLAKQWLRQYSSVVTGSARERAFVRQFRWDGFEVWRVRVIIGMLPTVLHTSVGLFLAGLVVFLYSLDTIVARVILGLSASLATAYAATTVLPIFIVNCPYRTQFSALLSWSVWQFLAICTKTCYSLAYRCFKHYSRRDLFQKFIKTVFSLCSHCDSKVRSRSGPTAKELERSAAVGAIQSIPERASELMVWLTSNTASSSAKQIVFQSLGSCDLNRMSSMDVALIFAHKCVVSSMAVANVLLKRDIDHDLAGLEAAQRWMRALFSCKWSLRSLEGFELSLPGLDLAILALCFVGGSDHTMNWPELITVKSRTEEFTFMGIEDRSQSDIKPIRERVLEHYDPVDPLCFPQNVWNYLQSRGCLPDLEDGKETLWKKVVDEVLTHYLEDAEELVFPESHQMPISFARYCAPMLLKKGWLNMNAARGLVPGLVSEDAAVDEVKDGRISGEGVNVVGKAKIDESTLLCVSANVEVLSGNESRDVKRAVDLHQDLDGRRQRDRRERQSSEVIEVAPHGEGHNSHFSGDGSGRDKPTQTSSEIREDQVGELLRRQKVSDLMEV